jgi:effector-binding domain-containing protein
MRILKYILLLLVLIFIAVAVFVATQKGDYNIVRTKIIKTPRAVVFNYVNDYGNWPSWIQWDDSGTDFVFSNVTAGKGASFSWDGSLSGGSMKTIFIKENDSIAQRMEMDGLPSEVSWKFKDTVGGTKVTWRIKGKMGFMPKIYAALKGGPEKVIGETYEKSLSALNKMLEREINTYSAKVDGIFEKPGNYYIYQSITSTMANMTKNQRVMMSKLVYFFKKNKMQMYGKPFISYEYFDTAKGLTKFSVCIPVAEEIFITPGSDIMAGKSSAFRAVKTTLKGDHSHLPEAWDKTFEYLKINKLTESEGGNYLEVYKINKDDVKSPSKWVTEIYIPINDPAPEAVVAPVVLRPAPEPVAAPAEEDISIP